MSKKQVPQYQGPSWAEISGMTNVEVEKAFTALKHEPHKPYPLMCYADDWSDSEAVCLQRQQVHYRECLRAELFSVYIERWVATLDEDDCWCVVTAFEGKSPSLSERRYTKPEELRERTKAAVYATEHGKHAEPQSDPAAAVVKKPKPKRKPLTEGDTQCNDTQ